jgi:hypothetical protein
MTKDEIIQMLLEASDMSPDTIPEKENDLVLFSMDELERFAALVAEKEREACAKVCDVEILEDAYSTALINSYAEDIRARGNK